MNSKNSIGSNCPVPLNKSPFRNSMMKLVGNLSELQVRFINCVPNFFISHYIPPKVSLVLLHGT